MSRIAASFILLLLCLKLEAQKLSTADYTKAFKASIQKKDTVATGKLLRQWQQEMPQDPEFYVAKFNYLLAQASAIELRRGGSASEGMLIKDKEGKVVGSLGPGLRPDLVAQACAVLRKGLLVAPERLDMWFGLAKTYEETHQPDEEVKTLTQALATHTAGGKPWLWRSGSALPLAEAELLPQSLEQYASYYWQQADSAALETGRQIAALIVKYYPKSALGPFNMGAYYGMKGDGKNAYPYLQQADELQPNDPTNVANLASLALELGYKDQAKKYVSRLEKYPDQQELVKMLKSKLK